MLSWTNHSRFLIFEQTISKHPMQSHSALGVKVKKGIKSGKEQSSVSRLADQMASMRASRGHSMRLASCKIIQISQGVLILRYYAICY